MPAAGIVTLIAVFLTVVALAGYLITISVILQKVSFTLGTIVAGLRAIAVQTEPLGNMLGTINKDLADSNAALQDVLARKAAGAGATTSRSNNPPTRRRAAARARG